eukprot:scaffold5_cov331-Pavlova_lutheri.AAC.19
MIPRPRSASIRAQTFGFAVTGLACCQPFKFNSRNSLETTARGGGIIGAYSSAAWTSRGS